MTATNPAIEVAGLPKSFGDDTVLDGVDLTVPEGTVYALLGPNGAGRTTIVNILSTLLTPGDGEIRVAGFDARREPAGVRAAIGVTGQSRTMTVYSEGDLSDATLAVTGPDGPVVLSARTGTRAYEREGVASARAPFRRSRYDRATGKFARRKLSEGQRRPTAPTPPSGAWRTRQRQPQDLAHPPQDPLQPRPRRPSRRRRPDPDHQRRSHVAQEVGNPSLTGSPGRGTSAPGGFNRSRQHLD
jgi:hypothetical protein